MPRLVGDHEQKTIRASWWAEGETCTIRKFSYGDRQYLAGQTVSMGIDPQSEVQVTQVQFDRMNLAFLERGIVAWTDDAGDPMPVTREAIAQLEERDADFILEELRDYNPRRQRSAEEQERFRGVSGGGDSAA
jgi:hypothetical protein